MKLTGTPAQLKLFAAFSDLLSQMPMTRISITHLVNAAGVNRSTFYLYYVDLPAFIKDLEDRLLVHIEEGADKRLQSAIKATIVSPDPQSVYPVFLDLTQSIADNFELFKELTAEDGDHRFADKLQLTLTEILFSNLEEALENKTFFEDIPADYAMPIFFSSILTIILHWLHKKKPESAQEVAKLITKSRYVEPYKLFRKGE